jgi:hypothetical protein
VFFFHRCKRVIVAILITSGKANGLIAKEIFLRQYTTSIPIIVYGRTSDRYFMYFGIFLFSGNNIKGRALVNTVPILTNPKNRNNCVLL